MTLTPRTAAGVLAAGLWTVVVWLVFVVNLDPAAHDTGFVVVHLALAAVNVLVGLWLAGVGVRAVRARRDAAQPGVGSEARSSST